MLADFCAAVHNLRGGARAAAYFPKINRIFEKYGRSHHVTNPPCSITSDRSTDLISKDIF